MTNDFQITIPKPCHEDWNKMTAEVQGRHCKVCCKTVVDFTRKSAEDIKNYLLENATKKVCGRFNSNQVSQPLPKFAVIPVNRNRYSRIRMFTLALYLVFGGCLFGIQKAEAQKIGKIKVERHTVGEMVMAPETPKQDTAQTLPPPVIADTTKTTKHVPVKPDYCKVIKGDVEYVPEERTAVKGMMVITNADTAGQVEKQDPIIEEELMGKIAIMEPQPIMGDTIFVAPIEMEEAVVGQIAVIEPLPPIEMIEPLPPVEITETIVSGEISVQWLEPTETEELHPVVPVEPPVEVFTVENAEVISTPIPELGVDNPQVEVFPNPAHGNIMLKYTVKTQDIISIDVFDASGRKVKSLQKPLLLYPGVYNTPYNLSDLRNGSYHIIMQSGNEAVNANVIIVK